MKPARSHDLRNQHQSAMKPRRKKSPAKQSAPGGHRTGEVENLGMDFVAETDARAVPFLGSLDHDSFALLETPRKYLKECAAGPRPARRARRAWL
jgi:hypothetical protein